MVAEQNHKSSRFHIPLKETVRERATQMAAALFIAMALVYNEHSTSTHYKKTLAGC